MFEPSKESTIVSADKYEWRPKTFPDFLEELQHLRGTIKEASFFRGHRCKDWFLDSTFARSLKVQNGMSKTERYSEDVLCDVTSQHRFARIWLEKLKRLQISPQLQEFRSKGLDVYFEYHRHHQQNPGDPLLADIAPFGTSFVDFTYNWKVALFFANRKRLGEEQAALFLVRQTALGKVFSRGADSVLEKVLKLEEWLENKPNEMYGHLPLMIYPEKQLNNLLDSKLKRQEAVYLMQIDFRLDLGLSWVMLHEKTGTQVFWKLILPPWTHKEIDNFLISEGITEDYLMPSTVFDRNIERK